MRPSPSNPSSSQLNLLRLSDIACQDPMLVGAKAATLARLFHVFPGEIPPGIVLAAPQGDSFPSIAGGDGYAKASETLLTALGERGPAMVKQYAVRSSALDEDSTSRSFAGQYETVLGLASVEEILSAIAACVRSATSARVAAYRRAAGPGPIGALGILIQEMIPADRAGVAFTVNPLTGRREVVINASFGLGDLLVSGEITPDEIIIDGSGRPPRLTVGSKRLMSVLTHRGIIRTPVPEALQVAPSLSGDQINSIVAVAQACETALNYPVDMEWAFSGGMLFVLQARPITAILPTGADRK